MARHPGALVSPTLALHPPATTNGLVREKPHDPRPQISLRPRAPRYIPQRLEVIRGVALRRIARAASAPRSLCASASDPRPPSPLRDAGTRVHNSL